MAFKLRSGNKSPFKNMGSSPTKDMKTGKYEHSFESPAKQRLKKGGEAQDEDKIFNKKGEHVGNWVGDKKVMFKMIKEGLTEGASELKGEFVTEKIKPKKPIKSKKKSPAKQLYGQGGMDDAAAFDKEYRAKKFKENFDARQASKQKGREFVKNLKTKKGVDIKTGKRMDTFNKKHVAKDLISKKGVDIQTGKKMDTFKKRHVAKDLISKKSISKLGRIGKTVKTLAKNPFTPAGIAAIAGEAMMPYTKKVAKATIKGLKKRAKSDSVNIGRKL